MGEGRVGWAYGNLYAGKGWEFNIAIIYSILGLYNPGCSQGGFTCGPFPGAVREPSKSSLPWFPRSSLVPTLPRGNPCGDAPASYLRFAVIAHANEGTGRRSVLTCVPTRERGNEAKSIFAPLCWVSHSLNPTYGSTGLAAQQVEDFSLAPTLFPGSHAPAWEPMRGRSRVLFAVRCHCAREQGHETLERPDVRSHAGAWERGQIHLRTTLLGFAFAQPNLRLYGSGCPTG